MRRAKTSLLTEMGVILCLLLAGAGCAGQAKSPEVYASPETKGAVFQIGVVKAGSFDTAPYLPTRISFYLEQDLKEKGLLATPAQTGKKLVADISVTAYYYGAGPSYYCYSCYSQLNSKVAVVDPATGKTVAQTDVVTYNAWGQTLSDYTESENAKKIAQFLSNISR